MSFFDKIILNLPEVTAPKQKRLQFKEKLKWTLVVLILFFVLGMVPLYGIGDNVLRNFEYLSIILGAQFGSLLSLGIGPIVTGSIILQLLNGSGIMKFDLTSHEGKQRFQGIQKLVSILFIIFEAAIYVMMGGLAPGRYYDPINNVFTVQAGASTIALSGSQIAFIEFGLIFQLFLGGMIVLFMDEIVSKWGFGSGISLFIAAGISKQIVIQLLSIFDDTGVPFWVSQQAPVGNLWSLLFFYLPEASYKDALLVIVSILATIVVFLIAVYAQSMKVEIPLSFGRIRGHGIRWPLNFIYTSNIPVILVASLFATLQLWVRLLQNWIGQGRVICWLFSNTPFCFPGGYTGNTPVGFISVLNGPPLLETLIRSGWNWTIFTYSVIYIILMILGAIIFSLFWVQTSGMDAGSQAEQMMSSGLQIPGFRKDKRILERLLSRYIGPLTVMGAITVGLLAALADLTGALARGTGILLTVMIVYKLYEDIAKEHVYDMNPLMRRFMGK
ncbi:preprotein translocase subunit SecY [Candidatus Woesearchaeota archaeon]|nr:preprotein translocase subunit SecY [Candidatus Woesearchaeota archaeon]